MENNLKFNSAICTSRVQSERLLALGLKKETADMCWLDHALTDDYEDWRETPIYKDWEEWQRDGIPAWSLNRLIELKQPNTIDNAVIILPREQTYDKLIDMIAKSIEGGKFPKEYLEE